ncbi:hypothetical protein ACQRIU_005193 [Beauveria bassiana]
MSSRRALAPISGNARPSIVPRKRKYNDDEDSSSSSNKTFEEGNPFYPPESAQRPVDTSPAPEPSGGPVPAVETSEEMLLREMRAWVESLPATMVRNLGGAGNELKMPLRAADARRLTWDKLADEMASNIAATNAPVSTSCCWFVPGRQSDTAGYPVWKIWGRGERNKWGIHRILFFMKNPALLPLPSPPAAPPANLRMEVSHLCGRGRFDFNKGIEVSCVNPYHCEWESAPVNKDRNYCRRACAAWCPHSPKCIWTNDAGLPSICRNAVPLTASKSTGLRLGISS